jgi:DNA-binding HxlR family transcriptional regulator
MSNVQTEAQGHIPAPAGLAHREASAYCPRFHYAAELLGRRWTGAIIRELTGGPRRFNELLASIPGLSDRLLCERLRELEGAHIVDRDVETGPPVKVSYALTKAGRELEPVLQAIAAWAERWVVR